MAAESQDNEYGWEMPIGPVYKAIDTEHAEAFARGSVKIGCWSSYAGLEDGKKDDFEGSLLTTLDSLVLTPQSAPEDFALAREMGVKLSYAPGAQGGPTTMSNMKRRQSVQSPWTFCASTIPQPVSPPPTKEQTVFEIANLLEFAYRVALADERLKWAQCRCAIVKYEPRVVDAFSRGNTGPSPFIKDPKYGGEREVRCVWIPPHDVEATTFIVSNAGTSNLVRKVGVIPPTP